MFYINQKTLWFFKGNEGKSFQNAIFPIQGLACLLPPPPPPCKKFEVTAALIWEDDKNHDPDMLTKSSEQYVYADYLRHGNEAIYMCLLFHLLLLITSVIINMVSTHFHRVYYNPCIVSVLSSRQLTNVYEIKDNY